MHETVLRELIQSGEVEELKLQKAAILAFDIEGASALHLAAEIGSVDVLSLFLEMGISLEKECDLYYTPLQVASMSGQLEATKFLIKAGAKLSRKTETLNILDFPAMYNDLPMFELLLAEGADLFGSGVLRQPVFWAVQEGGFQVFSRFLDLGVPITVVQGPNFDENVSLLYVAASEGHLEIVRELLKRGANLNVLTSEKVSAKMIANLYNHDLVVNELDLR